jgi:hypothetical protein
MFPDRLRAVFPGAPEIRGGYMYSNDTPGLERRHGRSPDLPARHKPQGEHGGQGTGNRRPQAQPGPAPRGERIS